MTAVCVCVFVWQAVDDDQLREHSTTVYQIVHGDPLGNFTVDRSTGVISVRSALDYELMPADCNGTFTLTLMAVDSQRSSLYDLTNVTIHVLVGPAT